MQINTKMCGTFLKRSSKASSFSYHPFSLTFKHYFLFFSLFLLSNCSQGQAVSSTENPPITFNFGAVLSQNENMKKFEEIVNNLNSKRRGLTFVPSTTKMLSNPILTAKGVCQNLVSQQVYAVIVGEPEDGELSVASVSYTCGFYNIPVIGIKSRDSAFSDKNVHSTFLRTVPPYSFQADMWVKLLKHLGYEKVVFIHTADVDGRAAYTLFVNGIDDTEISIEASVEFEAGAMDLAEELEKIFSKVASRVIILYSSKKEAEIVFDIAKNLGLTGVGFAWIITEQALYASNVPNGSLGLELPNAGNASANIHDAVQILSKAVRKMYIEDQEAILEAPSSCNGTVEDWLTGQKLVSYMKHLEYYGETGKVMFDESGDRIFAEYNVVNVVEKKRVLVGSIKYSKEDASMRLQLPIERVVWPPNIKEKPIGYHIKTHLKVVTVSERPFVTVEPLVSSELCDYKSVRCKKFNKISAEDEDFCCSGYCVELLQKLSERLNFTYEVFLEPDNVFGMPVKVNGTTEKQWTGLINELLMGNADMAVAALTITPERSQVIDFTKPFKYQGITILEKTQNKQSLLSSFLQPFQTELWILVMVSVHVVALALYLLDRFSPFGRYKLPNCDATEEDALNLSSAIWFAWGVLLNSGIGEGTPRSFSARVLGMVWAGFAMIVVASYTANLAAFLVLDRPDTSLSGINDARLRNPVENFTYATVKKSSVDMYFQKQVELSNMYRTMEGRNYDTVEEAVDAVKKDDLNAFIWDSARLDYEAAQDCILGTTGELFGRSGMGVGFVKNSYWTEPTTLAILEMHENGFMEELDKEWIYGKVMKCPQQEKGPVTLGLKNMGGVFILVGAGIVGGIGLIIIEIVYKKHQTSKNKKLELARHAADKWRGAVEKRKILRASIESQKKLKTNGMEILASGSLGKNYILQDPMSTSGQFSSFHPLSSPEVRYRTHHGSSSFAPGGSGTGSIYRPQDFVV